MLILGPILVAWSKGNEWQTRHLSQFPFDQGDP